MINHLIDMLIISCLVENNKSDILVFMQIKRQYVRYVRGPTKVNLYSTTQTLGLFFIKVSTSHLFWSLVYD